MKDAIIIGGGLAGLANAIWLAQKGHEVVLFEKHAYPRHKVCGEYVSREALPFLGELNLTPLPGDWPLIDELLVTTPSGQSMTFPLELGGFGVSRYQLDHLFYQKAVESGVDVHTKTKVNSVHWVEEDRFKVKTSKGTSWEANVVIGNFGKHSNIDRGLKRPFLQNSSPYIGVKQHIRAKLPDNQIALHNSPAAYCGISKVEDNRYCFCYLANRNAVKEAGGIEAFEQSHLARNPFLQSIFEEAEFLFEQPAVIGEVSFANKSLVQDHILMGGDAAGMIAPLCGNGMAMALHSAKILAPLVDQYLSGKTNRAALEKHYKKQWKTQFLKRLDTGRRLQNWVFGKPLWSEMALQASRHFPGIAKTLIQKTHGAPF